LKDRPGSVLHKFRLARKTIPWREVLRITASIGWTAELISSGVYSLMVVINTNLTTPILLRMSSRLRMAACAGLVGAVFMLFTNTGCAVKKIAVNKLGNALANGGTTY